MLRPLQPEDTPVLLTLAEGTGVFRPGEIDALREVLDDYHGGLSEYDHRAFTWVQRGQVVGFVYYAPAAMTDRSWYLYWIVVQKSLHGKGIGSRLLQHVEKDVRHSKGRILFIETSSLPSYEPTRGFYLRHGYEVTGVLKDFYADGDDMVVFRKQIEKG